MIPSPSWVQFLGRPGPKLHVIVDTPAQGGGYYLRYYVERKKAALDKVERIADSAALSARFNELYRPLSQGEMESDYVLGRGKDAEFSNEKRLPELAQEVADCYFLQFGTDDDDDDDLALEDSGVEIRRQTAETVRRQAERLKPVDLGPARKPTLETFDLQIEDTGEQADFSESVMNPFIGREVTRLEKVTYEFRSKIFEHWAIPTLTYDPAQGEALLQVWRNYLGVPLENPPGDENEYQLLFAAALEEISVSLRGYAGEHQIVHLMEIVRQVRKTRGAFHDHLEPFWDAMGWRYLDLKLQSAAEAAPKHPANDPDLASLILAITGETSHAAPDRLVLDPFAHTRVSAHEVWSCYQNFRPASPESAHETVDPEFEVRFNEALATHALDLPGDSQAQIMDKWRDAYTKFENLMVFLDERFASGTPAAKPVTAR